MWYLSLRVEINIKIMVSGIPTAGGGWLPPLGPHAFTHTVCKFYSCQHLSQIKMHHTLICNRNEERKPQLNLQTSEQAKLLFRQFT